MSNIISKGVSVSSVVTFMNHHKEAIKSVVGLGALAIGTKAAYDAITGKIYTKYAGDGTELKDTVNRVTLAFAQVSFVLSAAVSPLGVLAISALVRRVFTSAQLASVFGPNTNFVGNWQHPRHVTSLLAVGLAIPLVVKRLFIVPTKQKESILQMGALFTILTSRPVLHLGNQFAQRFFK